MRASELKRKYEENNPGGYFFSKATMRFFGNDLRTMRVSEKLKITDYTGRTREAYKLTAPGRDVLGEKRIAYHYFDAKTFELIYPATEETK